MTTERRNELELRLNVYRTEPPLNLLAFDDPRVGLSGELFVPSATTALDDLAVIVFGERRDEFSITFDSSPLQGWQARAVKVEGNADEKLREELGIDAEALTEAGQYAVAFGVGTYYTIDAMCLGSSGGNLLGKTLWLCPALNHYFPDAPQTLYVRLDPAAPEGRRRGTRHSSREGR